MTLKFYWLNEQEVADLDGPYRVTVFWGRWNELRLELTRFPQGVPDMYRRRYGVGRCWAYVRLGAYALLVSGWKARSE